MFEITDANWSLLGVGRIWRRVFLSLPVMFENALSNLLKGSSGFGFDRDIR